MKLQREKLELSPVYSTAMEHDGHKLGYIRLVNFSQHAANDMEKAVTQLEVRRVVHIEKLAFDMWHLYRGHGAWLASQPCSMRSSHTVQASLALTWGCAPARDRGDQCVQTWCTSYLQCHNACQCNDTRFRDSCVRRVRVYILHISA